MLDVRDLTIHIRERRVIDGISLSIAAGERVALVGESGSGKSLTALAIADLLDGSEARISSGRISINGKDRASMSPEERRLLRGTSTAIVFQDPLAALNPVYTAGEQIAEVLRVRAGLDRRSALKKAIDLLAQVKLRDPVRAAATFPHQLSGGMRQRVVIARALALDPKLLIADEPTTALDVITEAEVMDLLLEASAGRALLLISHDLSLVRERCSRVYVMEQGRIFESMPTEKAGFAASNARVPEVDRELLLHGNDLTWWLYGDVYAVNAVTFSLYRGETLAIVGESGAGKSTLARLILRLIEPHRGKVWFAGRYLGALDKRELLALRRKMQLVSQDPSGALDPRMRVGESLIEPLLIHGETRDHAIARAPELLRQVGLAPELANRFPHQLSGGERQRVAIARALSLKPDLLVLDEPMSSLDAYSSQLLLELLAQLQADLHLTYILITHDLRLVQRLADRVLVMRAGRVVEEGAAPEIFRSPRDVYTKALVAAARP